MKISSLFAVSLLSVLLLASCQSNSSYVSQGTTKYSIEGTEKFALLDKVAQSAITCTGLQEGLSSTGRLEVVANVKNRLSTAVQVRVRCVFKDAQGFATGDETAWQNLDLADEETEAVRFTAVNNLAHKYTIMVRSMP